MSPRPLKIAVRDHCHKALGLVRALGSAGHKIVPFGEPADVFLIDHDMQRFGFREQIDHYKALGATVLVYPHGGGPLLGYDNLWEAYDQVDGQLVFAPGHAEVLRRIDHPTPTHVIGWSYSHMGPFHPRKAVRRVLYAPTHPSSGGQALAETNRQVNAETFRKLLEGPWRVTVRHLDTIEQNGLWEADGVSYVRGRPNLSHVEIDTADVVVAAEGTFPSLAIARGVPVVMCGQAHPPMWGLPGETPVPLRNAQRYLDYTRYPFDVEDGPLDEVLHAAVRSDEPIRDWKRRFVGDPLNPAAFTAQIERIVAHGRAPVELDETRRFTVVALADELLERPQLLREFAAAHGPGDDATLVIWGAGYEAEPLLATVQAAVAAAGIGDEELPDVLLLPQAGSPAADRALAERADALLSEWPSAGRIGELPRFSATAQPAWA